MPEVYQYYINIIASLKITKEWLSNSTILPASMSFNMSIKKNIPLSTNQVYKHTIHAGKQNELDSFSFQFFREMIGLWQPPVVNSKIFCLFWFSIIVHFAVFNSMQSFSLMLKLSHPLGSPFQLVYTFPYDFIRLLLL
jgi:hypothetical protein